jgi:tetratricopeptide (TPR) repeat protein
MYELTLTYAALHRFDKSQELVSRLVECSKQNLGEDHPNTLWAIRSEAVFSIRNEDYEKSERLLSHVVEASMKHDSSPAHRDVSVYAGLDLVTVYLKQGQPQRAEMYLEEMLARLDAGSVTADPRHRLSIMGAMANLYFSESRLGDAATLYRNILERATRLFGKPNPYELHCMPQLARVLYQEGNLAEARAMMTQCAQDRLRILGPDSQQTVTVFEELRQFGVPESSLDLLKSKSPV